MTPAFGTTFPGALRRQAVREDHPSLTFARRILPLLATGCLCLACAVSSLAQPRPESGTLTVVIEGLEDDNGSVRIALSGSEENYYDYANPMIGVSVAIERSIARWQFPELPFGDYAIKAFHDADSDGDLDTNFLGIPIEDYGFSNNASGLFGPPSWEAARFRFRSDTMTVRISFE